MSTWFYVTTEDRWRRYDRQDPDRPGQTERRARAEVGERWCSGCKAWMPSPDVLRVGKCRPCANAAYRARYATDGEAIRRRVHARKRNVEPVPIDGGANLTERFDGRCAYCPAEATTWDHLVPVSKGGQTEPGNIVPACQPCNSSKNNRDLWTWLAATGRVPSDDLVDVLALAAVA